MIPGIPVLGSFLTVGTNLVFINLTCSLQHRAIALSTSLSGTLNFFFLALMLYRKLGGFGRAIPPALAKTGCAALVMGLAVFFTVNNPPLSGWLGSGLPGRLLSLLADILLGGGLYLLLVSRLKIPEFQELTRHLAARLKR